MPLCDLIRQLWMETCRRRLLSPCRTFALGGWVMDEKWVLTLSEGVTTPLRATRKVQLDISVPSRFGFLDEIKGFLRRSSSKLPHFLLVVPPMPTPLYLCRAALLAKTRSWSWLTGAEDKHTGQAAEGTTEGRETHRRSFAQLSQASGFFWKQSLPTCRWAFYTLHPRKDYRRSWFAYRNFVLHPSDVISCLDKSQV